MPAQSSDHHISTDKARRLLDRAQAQVDQIALVTSALTTELARNSDPNLTQGVRDGKTLTFELFADQGKAVKGVLDAVYSIIDVCNDRNKRQLELDDELNDKIDKMMTDFYAVLADQSKSLSEHMDKVQPIIDMQSAAKTVSKANKFIFFVCSVVVTCAFLAGLFVAQKMGVKP